MVVNEAAACGLPLVLSDQVGRGAPICSGTARTVSSCPPGDVDAAAAALARLADDPELRRSGRAVARARRELGLRAVGRELLAAVREAAAR